MRASSRWMPLLVMSHSPYLLIFLPLSSSSLVSLSYLLFSSQFQLVTSLVSRLSQSSPFISSLPLSSRLVSLCLVFFSSRLSLFARVSSHSTSGPRSQLLYLISSHSILPRLIFSSSLLLYRLTPTLLFLSRLPLASALFSSLFQLSSLLSCPVSPHLIPFHLF
jgi:hypothetical protein